MKPLILASCDDKYHDLYATPFRNSAEQHGMEVRIVRGGNINPGAAAALRYLGLPHVLKEYPSVLVLDIDSIINEPIDFNDKWEELHREGMLRELQNRIRDVRQSPDGFLYILTAENDGALMRMEPFQPAAP